MHDWWISLVAATFGNIAYVNQSTILYRQHGENDTGAKKYGLNYIIKRIFLRPRLDKYFIQIKVFGQQYNDKLNPAQQNMFNTLGKWNSSNFFTKRFLIVKYRLWKKGLIRKVGLLVLA